MPNATFSLLFIGAPVFLIGIVLAFRKSMRNRRRKAAPFRGYFATIDDRYFLQNTRESDDWEQESQSRFAPFKLRNVDRDLANPGVHNSVFFDGESN
jgi:hypothetical protein